MFTKPSDIAYTALFVGVFVTAVYGCFKTLTELTFWLLSKTKKDHAIQ